jgi:hypothetical protein
LSCSINNFSEKLIIAILDQFVESVLNCWMIRFNKMIFNKPYRDGRFAWRKKQGSLDSSSFFIKSENSKRYLPTARNPITATFLCLGGGIFLNSDWNYSGLGIQTKGGKTRPTLWREIWRSRRGEFQKRVLFVNVVLTLQSEV